MDSLNKLKVIDINSIDKSTVFIPVDSMSWRTPGKIPISALLSVNPVSLKVEVPSLSQNFYSEPFVDHDVSYNRPPQNASAITAIHAAVDHNYLYIWIETQKKWKRIPLSDWA